MESYDWEKSDVFDYCLGVKRFQMPKLGDQRATQIESWLTILHRRGYANSIELIEYYDFALDFLQEVVCYNLDMSWVWSKIRKSCKEINFLSTQKILVRAKIAQKLKDDAKLIICRYLDIMQLDRQIQQLRDENVSDCLIFTQVNQLVKTGQNLLIRSTKFLEDYRRTIDHFNICDTDLRFETATLVRKYRIM